MLDDILPFYEQFNSHLFIFRIDIPANRYDMLCVEGIARAIKTYLGLEKNPVSYSLSSPSTMQEIRVKVEVYLINS